MNGEEKIFYRIDSNFFKNFTSRWNYSYTEDREFINMFLQDSVYLHTSGLKVTRELPPLLTFLSNYYFTILNIQIKTIKDQSLKSQLVEEIDFFLILNTKSFKTKYTITNHEDMTLVTASVGMILKYYGKFRKSFKRSHRANVLLIRFVKSTIIRLIRKKKYVFIIEGFNSKLFTLINILNFMKNDTNLSYYLMRPKLAFGNRIFRKIKSIKRKLQRKNASSIKNYKSFLKRFSNANYQV